MATEVLGPHRREAPTLTPPGPPGNEIDLFDTNNDTAFLVMHTSRMIRQDSLPRGFKVLHLGRINELVSSSRKERISFVFDPERIDVARRVYREETPEVVKREIRELFERGYKFLPGGIPDDKNSLKQSKKLGVDIWVKIVAFRLKPVFADLSQPKPH